MKVLLITTLLKNKQVAAYSAKQNLTAMNNSLALVASKALPSFTGSSLTYIAEKNMYLTQGFTSKAGNTYYNALRISDRIGIFFHIGEGYAHTFLNGISLFAWNGHKARVIAERKWGGSNWKKFNEQFALEESVRMLKSFLLEQADIMGKYVTEKEALKLSRSMVGKTYRKRLSY